MNYLPGVVLRFILDLPSHVVDSPHMCDVSWVVRLHLRKRTVLLAWISSAVIKIELFPHYGSSLSGNFMG